MVSGFSKKIHLAAILIGVTAVRSVLRFFYQVVFETCSQGVLYEIYDFD